MSAFIEHSESEFAPSVVLVVDDHLAARDSVATALRCAGHRVETCASAIEALQCYREIDPDVILTDLQMPGMTGLEFIATLSKQKCEAQIVMATAHASVSSAVEAMRHGAFDYIEKPFDVDQLEDLIGRALRRGSQDERAKISHGDSWGIAMIGKSAAMQTLRQGIALAAASDETVLISGESGVGKELVARCLHAASNRSDKAFVGLNCPALNPQLMESELFGHERGAFTGADAPRTGRFELAEEGTILLDEVSEIEIALQAKLLRVLQEQAYERVGCSKSRPLTARVLATTNRDLRKHVAAGGFREDLYFRLAVLPIQVPALRERREDIPLLTEHFLGQAQQRTGQRRCELTSDAAQLLQDYSWPGNVRELENVIKRGSILSPNDQIDASTLRPWLLDSNIKPCTAVVDDASAESTTEGIQVGASLQQMERALIEATLDHFNGHRERTATALGIGVRTLANKLRSYGYAPREKSYQSA